MTALSIIAFSLFSTISSMDPPALEWVRTYGSTFYDVRETSNGDYIVAGRRWSDFARTLFLYDPDGNLVWESSVYPTDCRTQAVVETFDGGFVGTGYGLPSESSTQASLSIYKVSSSGDSLWAKLYDFSDGSRGEGFSIIQLPDSGFVVTGEIDPAEGMDQAWILRTDSEGDTLWTREWGWVYNDRAVSALYIDNGLTVLMNGRMPSSLTGPHLVRYDLSGNMIWETAVSGMQEDCYAQDICEASDGGLLILSSDAPYIAHTDYLGNPDWFHGPYGLEQSSAWSISSTMDGGFVVGVGSYQSLATISRHSINLGAIEWYDVVYDYNTKDIYSVRQLSEGGYIAAGRAIDSGYIGILLKYAPETGISEPDPVPRLSLEVFPNPCSSVLSVSFAQPEAGRVSVQVYDLSGRLVSSAADDTFPAGNRVVEWKVPDSAPSGCYVVQLKTEQDSITENMVLLR